jgi:hypothetical protein
MSQLKGKWILDNSIDGVKLKNGTVDTTQLANEAVTSAILDSTAKQAVLESKLIARFDAVTNKAVTGGSTVVTTEVQAVASVDTPRTALTALGVYTGAVSGVTDPKSVKIRAAGTDNGIDDGNGDDVFGVLTEAAGVFTLTYKKADGNAFSFATSTPIDFFFVEIYDLYSEPAEKGLLSVGGVVDSTSASAITNHINDTTGAHAASAISFSPTSLENTDATDIQELGEDLDAAIGALDATPTNYTPSDAAVVASHLEAIDVALASAGGSEFSDSDFRIKDNGDATKKLAFEVSGISSSATRTVTAANRNVDLTNITVTKTESLTLDGTDISVKYKDLTIGVDVINPSHTSNLNPSGGPKQQYATDYTIISDGTYVRRINWDGLGMDTVLEAGDALVVQYQIYG